MTDSGDDPDATTLDDLSDEFLARLRRGESPTLDEYSRRHPHLADAIEEAFPAIAALENLKIQRFGG